MWIQASRIICVRFPEWSLVLQPGTPVNIPKEQAQLLIEKAKGTVHLCHRQNRVIAQQDSLVEYSVTWRCNRIIRGPAKVECIDNSCGQSWLLVCWNDTPMWIRQSLLYSGK